MSSRSKALSSAFYPNNRCVWLLAILPLVLASTKIFKFKSRIVWSLFFGRSCQTSLQVLGSEYISSGQLLMHSNIHIDGVRMRQTVERMRNSEDILFHLTQLRVLHTYTNYSAFSWRPLYFHCVGCKAQSLIEKQPSFGLHWSPKAHYRAHWSPQLVPVLGHINPVHILTSLIFNIHFNIIPQLGLRFPRGLFPSHFPIEIMNAFLI